jgi:hypothetical protein
MRYPRGYEDNYFQEFEQMQSLLWQDELEQLSGWLLRGDGVIASDTEPMLRTSVPPEPEPHGFRDADAPEKESRRRVRLQRTREWEREQAEYRAQEEHKFII